MAGSKKTVVILVSVGVLSLLVCCGGGAFFANMGLNMVTEQVQANLQGLPQIQEHIGDIESFEMDFMASADYDDEDTFIYDIEGTRGTGRISVQSLTAGDDEVLQSATLTLEDGRVIEIDVQQSSNEFDTPLTPERPLE